MSMQQDLNILTLSAANANYHLTMLLKSYDNDVSACVESHSTLASNWSNALNIMNDALEKFAADGVRLQEYLNGK